MGKPEKRYSAQRLKNRWNCPPKAGVTGSNPVRRAIQSSTYQNATGGSRSRRPPGCHPGLRRMDGSGPSPPFLSPPVGPLQSGAASHLGVPGRPAFRRMHFPLSWIPRRCIAVYTSRRASGPVSPDCPRCSQRRCGGTVQQIVQAWLRCRSGVSPRAMPHSNLRQRIRPTPCVQPRPPVPMCPAPENLPRW